MKQKHCLICYKPISDLDTHHPIVINLENDDDDVEDSSTPEQETLTKFFSLLERYLTEGNGNGKAAKDIEVEAMRFPFEQLIKAGMLSCGDCFKTVESFCQLYHQMKHIDLLLQWKVWMLTNSMLSAQRLPSRMNRFQESVNQLDIGDITADEIIDFKGDLLKKCFRKLSSAKPQVILPKLSTKKINGRPQNLNRKNKRVRFSEEADEVFEIHDRPEVMGVDDAEDKENVEADVSNKTAKSISTSNRLLTKKKNGRAASSNPPQQVDMGQPEKNSTSSKLEVYRCSRCPNKFQSRKGLLFHYSAVHIQMRFNCKLCEKKFSYRKPYNEHYQREHLGIRKLNQCRACGKTFSKRHSLVMHRRQRSCSKKVKIVNESVDKEQLGKQFVSNATTSGKETLKNRPIVTEEEIIPKTILENKKLVEKQEEDTLHVPDLDFTLEKKTLIGTTIRYRIQKSRLIHAVTDLSSCIS